MVTIYTRYLLDICEHILLVPDRGFKMNPDNSNPFNERMNPGFSMEQRTIEPDEKVNVYEIP